MPVDDLAVVGSTTTTTTGLRLRFRSTDSHIPNTFNTTDDFSATTTTPVPRRPAPQTPPRNLDDDDLYDDSTTTPTSVMNHPITTNNSPLRHTALSPHPASLSHGMLPLVQHALLLRRPANANASRGVAPPRSRLDPRSGVDAGSNLDGGAPPDTTEFLSRLLLLLGSFVIFCLLLF